MWESNRLKDFAYVELVFLLFYGGAANRLNAASHAGAAAHTFTQDFDYTGRTVDRQSMRLPGPPSAELVFFDCPVADI